VALAYTEGSMAGKVRKIVAAFVLIWALADLTVPGLCQADDNKIDPTDTLLSQDFQEQKALRDWAATQTPLPAQDDTRDECFCCSPYASPTGVFDTHASASLRTTVAGPVAAPVVVYSFLPTETEELPPIGRRRPPSTFLSFTSSLLRC
jgi:hypothetical protein